MAAPTSPTEAALRSYPAPYVLAELLGQLRRWETELGGTAPTTPTTASLYHAPDSYVLSLILEQLRRVETAAGGTAPSTPTTPSLSSQGDSYLLAACVAQARRIDAALGGTPSSYPADGVLASMDRTELLARLTDALRGCETAAGGTAPTSPSLATMAAQPQGALLAALVGQARRNEDAGGGAVSHTVTFNGNDATSGSTSPQTASVPTNLTANGFARIDYNFGEWNTAADGSGTTYADGASYSFSADLTLYAQWEPQYTVTFDANAGGGESGNTPAQTAVFDSNLTANGFTLPGYTFANWNTAADGSGTTYANGASFPFTANTTLYAQWTPE